MERSSRLVGCVLVALSFALAMAFGAGEALARGSVRIDNPNPKEDEGEWKLKFTIDYGAEPHLAHIPMVFEFTPVAIYERSLTDASPDKAVTNRKALVNATPINLNMDVGFADMRGKMFKVTKFSMKLTREAEFAAGEYDLVVKLAAGGTLGARSHIKLQGENKAIDRRAIEFTAKAPPPKKKDPAADEPVDTGPKPAEDMGPDLSDIADDPNDVPAGAGDDGKVKPKQGGCGCHAVGAPVGPAPWPAVLALGALAMATRRSRRAGAKRIA